MCFLNYCLKDILSETHEKMKTLISLARHDVIKNSLIYNKCPCLCKSSLQISKFVFIFFKTMLIQHCLLPRCFQTGSCLDRQMCEITNFFHDYIVSYRIQVRIKKHVYWRKTIKKIKIFLQIFKHFESNEMIQFIFFLFFSPKKWKIFL